MDLAICQDNNYRKVPVYQGTTGGRRMSKQIYWKCVDCQSMITDENMVKLDFAISLRYASVPVIEFCDGCFTYNPEVVLAYD
jgi:hypothetical protein